MDMNENQINNELSANRNVSVYQQLSGILNALKTDEITINDAMNKIQLKDNIQLRPSRPYCKITSSGALALYGITKQPIVLYAEQWNKLLKITKSNYIDNYIKYNENRLKYKNNKINIKNNDVNNDDFNNIFNESTIKI